MPVPYLVSIKYVEENLFSYQHQTIPILSILSNRTFLLQMNVPFEFQVKKWFGWSCFDRLLGPSQNRYILCQCLLDMYRRTHHLRHGQNCINCLHHSLQMLCRLERHLLSLKGLSLFFDRKFQQYMNSTKSLTIN